MKREESKIELLLAKTKDDFLVSGKFDDVKNYMQELGKEFTVGKVSIGGTFRFIGCEIDIGDKIVKISMWDYLDRIRNIKISDDRRHRGELLASNKEEA